MYDLEVTPDIKPLPADGEVEEFYLWDVKTTKEAVAREKFKPSCAVVLLDFFIRRGMLTVENAKYYAEIVSRIHYKLPFLLQFFENPGRHSLPRSANRFDWVVFPLIKSSN